MASQPPTASRGGLSGIVSAKISSMSGVAAEFIPYQAVGSVDSAGFAHLSFTRVDLEETETRTFKLPPSCRVELKACKPFFSLNISTSSGVVIKLNFSSKDTQQRWHALLKPAVHSVPSDPAPSPRGAFSLISQHFSLSPASASRPKSLKGNPNPDVFDWTLRDAELQVPTTDISSLQVVNSPAVAKKHVPTYEELLLDSGKTGVVFDLKPPPPQRTAAPPALPPRPLAMTPIVRHSKEDYGAAASLDSVSETMMTLYSNRVSPRTPTAASTSTSTSHQPTAPSLTGLSPLPTDLSSSTGREPRTTTETTAI